MSRLTRRAAAVIGAAALLLPSAALANDKPEGAGKPPKPAKPAKPVKTANYIVKGVWNADGTVTVSGGNARVRKGGLIGATLTFTLDKAKLRVADTNGDGAVDVTDIVAGDKVVVQARLPRTEPGEGPFAARKLVDQTHPQVEEQEVPETEVSGS
jgi:hypothetical protein